MWKTSQELNVHYFPLLEMVLNAAGKASEDQIRNKLLNIIDSFFSSKYEFYETLAYLIQKHKTLVSLMVSLNLEQFDDSRIRLLHSTLLNLLFDEQNEAISKHLMQVLAAIYSASKELWSDLPTFLQSCLEKNEFYQGKSLDFCLEIMRCTNSVYSKSISENSLILSKMNALVINCCNLDVRLSAFCALCEIFPQNMKTELKTVESLVSVLETVTESGTKLQNTKMFHSLDFLLQNSWKPRTLIIFNALIQIYTRTDIQNYARVQSGLKIINLLSQIDARDVLCVFSVLLESNKELFFVTIRIFEALSRGKASNAVLSMLKSKIQNCNDLKTLCAICYCVKPVILIFEQKLNAKVFVDFVLNNLTHQNAKVRKAAFYALGALSTGYPSCIIPQSEDFINHLFRFLCDEDQIVRENAICTLNAIVKSIDKFSHVLKFTPKLLSIYGTKKSPLILEILGFCALASGISFLPYYPRTRYFILPLILQNAVNVDDLDLQSSAIITMSQVISAVGKEEYEEIYNQVLQLLNHWYTPLVKSCFFFLTTIQAFPNFSKKLDSFMNILINSKTHTTKLETMKLLGTLTQNYKELLLPYLNQFFELTESIPERRKELIQIQIETILKILNCMKNNQFILIFMELILESMENMQDLDFCFSKLNTILSMLGMDVLSCRSHLNRLGDVFYRILKGYHVNFTDIHFKSISKNDDKITKVANILKNIASTYGMHFIEAFPLMIPYLLKICKFQQTCIVRCTVLSSLSDFCDSQQSKMTPWTENILSLALAGLMDTNKIVIDTSSKLLGKIVSVTDSKLNFLPMFHTLSLLIKSQKCTRETLCIVALRAISDHCFEFIPAALEALIYNAPAKELVTECLFFKFLLQILLCKEVVITHSKIDKILDILENGLPTCYLEQKNTHDSYEVVKILAKYDFPYDLKMRAESLLIQLQTLYLQFNQNNDILKSKFTIKDRFFEVT